MKKTLLALILFLTILLGFPIGRLFALETVYLTPEFIDNATYNLETGAYIPLNTSWACTNRETVPVGTAVVTVNNLLAHHVLFFTETNGYIGYGNLITSYEGGTRYIATYADSSIELPANTAKVAFTVNKTGSAVPSGLGAYTYEDIFDSPTYLTYDDAVLGDTLGDVFTSGTYTNYTDALLNSVTLDEAFNNSFDVTALGVRLIETEWPDAGAGVADDWYKQGVDMTPSIVNGAQRADWTSNQNSGYFYHTMSYSDNHVYYVQVTFTDGTTAGTQYIEMRNGTSRIPFMSDMTTGVNYGTATALWSASAYVRLWTDGPRSGDYVVYDDFYMYDLTAIFGHGREVSASVFYGYLQAGTIGAFTSAENLGYSRADINGNSSEFTSEGITVLSLTNLIHNGQFSTDSNVDGLADYWVIGNSPTPFLYDDIQFLRGNNSGLWFSLGIEIIPIYASTNIYYSYDFTHSGYQTIYEYVYVGSEAILTGSNPVSGTYSNIFTTSVYGNGFQFATSGETSIPLSHNQFNGYDNVSLFNSGSYTKTQIDTALSYFGYLTYNSQYDLPDTTDADFTDEYYIGGADIGAGLYLYDLRDRYYDGSITAQTSEAFDTWLSLWGSGVNTMSSSAVYAYNPTALYLAGVDVDEWTNSNITYYVELYEDAFEQNERYEWYSTLGITAGNYGYYASLYDDATNTVERYEWYAWAGVTSGNYTALRATYDFYEDNYGTNYAFSLFDNLVATYDREEIVPIEDLTVVEKIEDWFENTLGLAEFADFFYFIISVVLVVIIVIVLAVFHAPSIIVLVVGGLTLVLFIAIGWFPFWLALLLTIGLIALFVFKKPSGGNA